MLKSECFELGYVSKVFGIKGEVKAVFDSEHLDTYRRKKLWFIEKNEHLIPVTLKLFRPVPPDQAILFFEEINSPEEAKILVGKKIFLPLSYLPKLKSDQFYYHDAIGATVVDQKAGTLGVITDFYVSSGQDVLAMLYQNAEILIPVTGQIVLNLDTEKKELYTNLPEGLIEVYLSGDEEID